jgi:hypothetical protein
MATVVAVGAIVFTRVDANLCNLVQVTQLVCHGRVFNM